MKAVELIIKELFKSRMKTRDDLARLKRRMAKQYRVPCLTNVSLLKTYHELVKNKRLKPSKKIEGLFVKGSSLCLTLYNLKYDSSIYISNIIFGTLFFQVFRLQGYVFV